MNDEERRGRLKKLRPDECELLYWRCKGKPWADAGKQVHMQERTVYNRVARIYRVLGLDGNKFTRQARLASEYCSILLADVRMPDECEQYVNPEESIPSTEGQMAERAQDLVGQEYLREQDEGRELQMERGTNRGEPLGQEQQQGSHTTTVELKPTIVTKVFQTAGRRARPDPPDNPGAVNAVREPRTNSPADGRGAGDRPSRREPWSTIIVGLIAVAALVASLLALRAVGSPAPAIVAGPTPSMVGPTAAATRVPASSGVGSGPTQTPYGGFDVDAGFPPLP